jgi:hypothetical protein
VLKKQIYISKLQENHKNIWNCRIKKATFATALTKEGVWRRHNWREGKKGLEGIAGIRKRH